MRKGPAWRCACALAALAAAAAAAAARAAAPAEPPARIEAHSADLLAVGLVRGDRMIIHVSRSLDNAPVQGAAVTVVLRGVAHPATAQIDGSYTLETPDLAVPGEAAVDIQVAQGGAEESLKGMLQVAAAGRAQGGNSARQLWWWVLNFAVCIGFLWLVSRRRKSARA